MRHPPDGVGQRHPAPNRSPTGRGPKPDEIDHEAYRFTPAGNTVRHGTVRPVSIVNTTNLFVELIVIGVGASVWLVLLTLAVFGYAWVPVDQLLTPFAAVPILAVIYVLGIVSDRVADAVFESIWSDDLRTPYFRQRKEYYDARRLILTRSERLSDLLEYGRSRLRICRGWAFNSILIAVTHNLLLWLRLADEALAPSISVFGSIALLTFSYAAWFSWKKLSENEYRKIKEQAQFITATQTASEDR